MIRVTIGSLFDGIGLFPLAASRYGITPIWAGGKYPSSDPFKKDVCEVQTKKKTKKGSMEVSEEQEIHFPLCSQDL